MLTNYGPLAGIWFDPIMGYYARPDLFPIHETYAMIRQLQPQALICFKQGATGAEDFLLNTTKASVEMLKKHGFSPVYKETPGGHTWINWRNYLCEFAPQLFQ